jgi:hypothetical protein
MNGPSAIHKMGERANELFAGFCESLHEHETQLAVAIPVAVALGLAVHEVATNPSGAGEAVAHAVEAVKQVYEVTKMAHELTEEACVSAQAEDLLKYTVKGYITPLVTTEEGRRMLVKTPLDVIKDYGSLVSTGMTHVRSFFTGEVGRNAIARAEADTTAQRTTEAVADAISPSVPLNLKKPLFDNYGRHHKLVTVSKDQIVTKNADQLTLWDLHSGVALNGDREYPNARISNSNPHRAPEVAASIPAVASEPGGATPVAKADDHDSPSPCI